VFSKPIDISATDVSPRSKLIVAECINPVPITSYPNIFKVFNAEMLQLLFIYAVQSVWCARCHQLFSKENEPDCQSAQMSKRSTAAAAPPPSRPGDPGPALCGSRVLVTPC